MPSYLSDPSSRLSQGIEFIPLFQSDLFVAEENEPTDVFEREKDRLPSLHAAVLVALALLLLLLGLHIGVGLAVPTVAPVLAARQRVADVDQHGLVRLPLCRRYPLVYPSAVHRKHVVGYALLASQIAANSDQSSFVDPAAVRGSL